MDINTLLKKFTKNEVPPRQVVGLTLNSKEVKDGYIFFAVKGSNVDGNLFIVNAVKQGAVAIFSEQECSEKIAVPYIKVANIANAMADVANIFYNQPAESLDITAITGTKGKTSITYLFESVLNEANKKNAVIGTINYRQNGKIIKKAKNTTPHALDLYNLLNSFNENKTSNLVMEVSSHSLELGRVRNINFNRAVFTNLQRDHLDFHETFENYFKSKVKLFDNLLSKENIKPNKTAIINIDDEYGQKLIKHIDNKIKVIPFSFKDATNIQTNIEGVSFTFKNKKVKINLLGKHNIYNALATLALAESVGIDIDTAISGLSKLKQVPGRLQRIDEGQNFYAFVDFAYTQESLDKALSTLAQFKKSKIITVFGCGGQRDTTKRPLMGQTACQMSDFVFITNDNPRKEPQEQIFKDIEAGIKDKKNYKIVSDRKEAICQAIKMAEENDIVIVAGKGHEDYQLFADKTIHFSDEEVIKEAIKQNV